MMVGDVLVVTASATTKIRADRVDPLGRADDHVLELGPIEAFLVFDHFGLDSFSIDRERDENDFSVDPANAGSAERDVMNVKSDRRRDAVCDCARVTVAAYSEKFLAERG